MTEAPVAIPPDISEAARRAAAAPFKAPIALVNPAQPAEEVS